MEADKEELVQTITEMATHFQLTAPLFEKKIRALLNEYFVAPQY